MGPPRHLSLVTTAARQIEWPVPFADGLPLLKGLAGQRVALLVSGDPFWYGAGLVIARNFPRDAWQAFPAPSTFSRVAAHLGWGLEATTCLGLHAAPMTQLRPHLQLDARLIVLLRDGAALTDLGTWMTDLGFGTSRATVFEALGGARQRIRTSLVAEIPSDAQHPVTVALEIAEGDAPLPVCTGLADDVFTSDGTMTKRPLRAITLSSLAPRAGELLWDLGAGTGTIGIEWMLAHPKCRAIAVEARDDRVALIRHNAVALGVPGLRIVKGATLDVLADLAPPDAVFIGGGLSDVLLTNLFDRLAPGTRIVANAVTLEAETLMADWQARVGGTLMRVEIADAAPMGSKRGWQARYPVVQWSVTR